MVTDIAVAVVSTVLVGVLNYWWEWLDHHMYDDDGAARWMKVYRSIKDPKELHKFNEFIGLKAFTFYHTGNRDGVVDTWHKVKKVVIVGVFVVPAVAGYLIQSPVMAGATLAAWAIVAKLSWKLFQKWGKG